MPERRRPGRRYPLNCSELYGRRRRDTKPNGFDYKGWGLVVRSSRFVRASESLHPVRALAKLDRSRRCARRKWNTIDDDVSTLRHNGEIQPSIGCDQFHVLLEQTPASDLKDFLIWVVFRFGHAQSIAPRFAAADPAVFQLVPQGPALPP